MSDAACAREILRRDEEFTKNGPGSFSEAMTAGLGPMALGNMDGNEHRQLRAAMSDLLTRAKADLLVDNRSHELALLSSRLTGNERVDLVQFVRGWSARIALDLLGVAPSPVDEESACQDIVATSERLSSILGFSRPSQRQIRNAQADAGRIAAYFRDSYERPAPESSLIERLQKLDFSFEQSKGLLVMVIMAGTLTNSAALPRIVALLVDSGSFNQLAENSAGIPRAIDEGLRFVTPLPGTVRIVRSDAVVRGHKLAAGTRLLILTGNVARDATLYPNPDRFDITRVHDPHARRPWYGAGPHRCAGLNLAQRQLSAVLGAVTGAASNLRIVKRRVAVGALLPAYAQLIVQSADRIR